MTRLVISFNRHFFGIAILVSAIGIALLILVDNLPLRLLLASGVGLAIWFMVASIVASYFVYDASDLYKLKWWPARIFAESPRESVLLHAGFDPSSPALRERYPEMNLRVLDFFDAQTTTEASIQRAYELHAASFPSESTRFDSWSIATGSQDAVFALSAAHELRQESERIAFFAEAKRVLKSNGRIVVIEQLRDAVNFSCFGLAAFHFFARETWLRSFRAAGLSIADEFKISPFMTTFVLQSRDVPQQKAA